MLIRKATRKDWSSILQIQQTSRFVYYTGYLSKPSKPDVKGRWEKRLGEPLVHTLVADLDGRAIGYIRLKQGEGKGSHVGEISIVAVHPDFQRRGIGTRLMKAILDMADNSMGLKRLRLTVHADNHIAVHLYESLGFEIEGRERKAVFKDEKYVDLLIMGRLADSD